MTETILVVDDSTFIVEGLAAILKKYYRTICVSGGEQCLEVLKKEKPDVIILDILMEPMDGWETLENIRANAATRQIPILMFSAKKISPEEGEQHRMSIDDFITKPVSPKQLLETIRKLLDRQNADKRKADEWRANGVPPEKIDEYYNLLTSINVDTSLLAVMKKELDSGINDERSRQDVLSSVATIKERMDNSRERAEKLLREMAEIRPSE